jgi:hypothetical protein
MTPGQIIAASLLVAALAVAFVTRGDHRRTALTMAGAVVLMRFVVDYTPADWRYLASAALWVSVGTATIRRGLVRSGALLTLSGVCYAAQQRYGAPPVVGNPFLAAADLCWIAALWMVWRDGRVDHGRAMGGGADRRDFLACDCRATMSPEAGGE